MERVGVGCPVPRLVRTRQGGEACEIAAGGRTCPAILITVVPGAPGDLARGSAALRRDVGRTAAALGLALAGYDHPAARRVLLWDLMQLDRFSGVVDAVSDPVRRRWLAATVERFAGEVRPRAAGLPAQVIHNDLNGGNVFVDRDRVSGVIDFGDMVWAPRINEVAVAANYCMAAERDPVAAIGEVLDGYDTLRPLDEAEVDLLHDLVSARLALRILMYQWRAALFPENRDYILRNGEAARLLADRFAAAAPGAGRDAVLKRWSTGRRGS
jgi:hydroxylysine kinase